MTDKKFSIFGPSGVIDPATWEPRAGKTFWMAATGPASVAVKLGSKDGEHNFTFGTTREGMTSMQQPQLEERHGE